MITFAQKPAVSSVPKPNPLNAKLIAAVKAESVQQVKVILSQKADPNVEDHDSGFRVPVLNAALSNVTDEKASREIALMLIESGANVNTDGSTGFTPLMLADDTEVIQLLLKKGADPSLGTARSGFSTPLHNAVWKPIVTKLLIAAKANINAKTLRGNTPLIEAVSRINQNVDENGQIEPESEGEKDILACMESIRLLINAGADLSIKNDQGQTAVSLAKESKYKPLIDLLQSFLKA